MAPHKFADSSSGCLPYPPSVQTVSWSPTWFGPRSRLCLRHQIARHATAGGTARCSCWRPDGAAGLGAHRASLSGRHLRHRSPPALHRQGQEATLHTSASPDSRRAADLDDRTRRGSQRPGVPWSERTCAQPRRRRTSGCSSRNHCCGCLPLHSSQTSLAARSPSHGSHTVARGRSRHLGDCPLARARVDPDHRHLPAR